MYAGARCQPDIHGSDRIFCRAAAGTGVAGGGQCNVRIQPRPHAARHGGGNLCGYLRVRGNDGRINAKKVLLDLIGVGDTPAGEHGGCAGDSCDALPDHAARAGFRAGNSQAALPQDTDKSGFHVRYVGAVNAGADR